jgi:O-antigen/teichoic acid export membrane protein
MIKRANIKDFLSGSSYQVLIVLSGIILLPASIFYLDEVQIGFWYVFLAFSALSQLLEFGYQPTISRLISGVLSGAQKIEIEGWAPQRSDNINFQLLYDLVDATKKLYRLVAVLVFSVLTFGGTAYLSTFSEFDGNVITAWLLLIISLTINFYYTYCSAILTGRGDTLDLFKITACSKLISTMVTLILLTFEFGLFSMSIGLFINTIITRVWLYKKVHCPTWAVNEKLKQIQEVDEKLTKTLIFASWKLGLTGVGAFLIRQGNTFIAASFLSLEVAGSYGLTIQIIVLIRTLSSMVFGLNLPKMNSLQASSDVGELRSVFNVSLKIAIILYTVGCAFFITVGNLFIEIISSNTKLLSMNLLIFLCVIYLLEHIHSLCGTYLTTHNKVPFLWPSLISGVAVSTLAFVLCAYLEFGVLGLLISQFIVQLIYNNWKWPYLTYLDLYRRNN